LVAPKAAAELELVFNKAESFLWLKRQFGEHLSGTSKANKCTKTVAKNLVAPKVAAKLELVFNKPGSDCVFCSAKYSVFA
jgi:hypothetical protein